MVGEVNQTIPLSLEMEADDGGLSYNAAATLSFEGAVVKTHRVKWISQKLSLLASNIQNAMFFQFQNKHIAAAL